MQEAQTTPADDVTLRKKVQVISIMVPNTDVVLMTEWRNVVRMGGTKEHPLIFIRGIQRAFWPATKANLEAAGVDLGEPQARVEAVRTE